MPKTRPVCIVALSIGLSLVSMSAAAQGHTPEWGTSAVSVFTVPHTAFSRVTSFVPAMDSSTVGNGGVCSDFTSPCKDKAAFFLPSGAKIIGIDLEACDFVSGGEAAVELFNCPVGTTSCTSVVTVTTGLAATPGCTVASLGINLTVQNASAYYPLISTLNDNSMSLLFRAVRLRYQLQVSPPPATATFPNDVPTTHPFFKFVEALAAAGITAGCAPGSYCPNDPITRGQMAVFLSVALGMHFPN
jgi:S-layer family protein